MLRRSVLSLALVAAACSGVARAPVAPTSSTTTTPVDTAPPYSTPASTSSTAAPATIDAAAWRADLDALVADLERLHPNPWWRVGEDAFKEQVADVSARLPTLTADQATLEIVRLAAEIDGHTEAFVGYLGWSFSRIQFYEFDDGIAVVGAADPDLLGARLVAIGGTPAAEAFQRASVLASYDNPETKAFTTPFFLAVPRLLAGLGITDDPSETEFTIQRRDGVTVAVTPETGGFDQYRAWFGDPVIGLPMSDRSLYLAHKTTPFWWTTLDDGSVYLQYNSVTGSGVDPSTGEAVNLRVVVDEVSAALDASPGSALIVDLRHNLGGDHNTYWPLLSMLVDRYGDSCGLYVISGRATFSAAVNFATEVEQQTRAVFVGEPTGGSPNLYGDVSTVTLPNSGIEVLISRRYWEYGGPDDHRIWIEPSISVRPTMADWIAGNDAALAAIPAGIGCPDQTG